MTKFTLLRDCKIVQSSPSSKTRHARRSYLLPMDFEKTPQFLSGGLCAHLKACAEVQAHPQR